MKSFLLLALVATTSIASASNCTYAIHPNDISSTWMSGILKNEKVSSILIERGYHQVQGLDQANLTMMLDFSYSDGEGFNKLGLMMIDRKDNSIGNFTAHSLLGFADLSTIKYESAVNIIAKKLNKNLPKCN